MDEMQQQLFGLMEMAEGQQKAVGATLAALVRQQAELGRVVAQLKEAGQGLVPAVEAAAGTGAEAGIKAELETLAKDAAAALEIATRPVLDRLRGVGAQAEAAEAQLKGAAAWFGWRWVALVGALGAGAIAAVLVAAWGLVWWERSQVEGLQAERARLSGEVAAAQATLDLLDKRTGGVRYAEASDGRFLLVRKGFEAMTCVNNTPCVRLK